VSGDRPENHQQKTIRGSFSAGKNMTAYLFLTLLQIKQAGFQCVKLLIQLSFLTNVSPIVPKMQDDIGCKEDQENKRTVFQHPYSPLHMDEELKVIALAIHVNTEKKDKKMENSEDRIKDESISFHHGGTG
jgi:hypothetical protein